MGVYHKRPAEHQRCQRPVFVQPFLAVQISMMMCFRNFGGYHSCLTRAFWFVGKERRPQTWCFIIIYPYWNGHISRHTQISFLVVSTVLKNISQLGWLFPICGKIKTCSKPPTNHFIDRLHPVKYKPCSTQINPSRFLFCIFFCSGNANFHP